MPPKDPNPWRRRKEKPKGNHEEDLYTIQIERSLERAAEVKLSVFENIDGIIIDDFYNTAIGEGEDDPEALTTTELRQLATKLQMLLRQTKKKYVYANVNKTLRWLLENKFGGEWIQTDDAALANAVGVDQFIRLTPATLEAIASRK